MFYSKEQVCKSLLKKKLFATFYCTFLLFTTDTLFMYIIVMLTVQTGSVWSLDSSLSSPLWLQKKPPGADSSTNTWAKEVDHITAFIRAFFQTPLAAENHKYPHLRLPQHSPILNEATQSLDSWPQSHSKRNFNFLLGHFQQQRQKSSWCSCFQSFWRTSTATKEPGELQISQENSFVWSTVAAVFSLIFCLSRFSWDSRAKWWVLWGTLPNKCPATIKWRQMKREIMRPARWVGRGKSPTQSRK